MTRIVPAGSSVNIAGPPSYNGLRCRGLLEFGLAAPKRHRGGLSETRLKSSSSSAQSSRLTTIAASEPRCSSAGIARGPGWRLAVAPRLFQGGAGGVLPAYSSPRSASPPRLAPPLSQGGVGGVLLAYSSSRSASPPRPAPPFTKGGLGGFHPRIHVPAPLPLRVLLPPFTKGGLGGFFSPAQICHHTNPPRRDHGRQCISLLRLNHARPTRPFHSR